MFRRRRNSIDFRAEIDASIQLEADRLREEGLAVDEALAAARRAFGNRTLAQERFTESGSRWPAHLARDMRYGLRVLARSPGFTTAAVLTLALGIGANTAIFSAVYAALLRPLPFRDVDRIVFVMKKNPPRGWSQNPISPTEILGWRDESGVFEDLAAYTQTSCVLTGAGEPEEDPCEIASGNLFQVLGAAPFLGRAFSADEDKSEGPRAAILSYGLWHRRFGADTNVVGRAMEINGAGYSIAGVMPAGFSHQYGTPYGAIPEMWLSGIGLSPEGAGNDYFGIGRLKPGISLEQAASRMDAVSVRMEQTLPDLKGWRAQMMTLRAMISGDTRPALMVLAAAVIFVLLIACANIANLLLARSAGRAGEFAVRTALGASRGRIVRQLLAESLVISLAGGALGVLLAFWGCQGLAALAPPVWLRSAPGLASGAADPRVLAFALVTALLTTLFFGLAPALQSARLPTVEALQETGRNSLQGPRSRRFRNALAVSEIALAMVLLVGAGLMVRTLGQLSRLNLGVDPAHVLTLRVPLSGDRYKEPQVSVEFWDRVVAAVKALPGVESASVSRGAALGDWWAGQFFVTSDQPNPPAGHVPDANYVIAGPDYFSTMRIPLRRGRSFNQHDTQSGERVAIVNEELVRLHWPGQDPLGKRLRIGPPTSPWLTVVGVAGNVMSQGPEGGIHAEVYTPYQQFPWLLGGPHHLLLRTSAMIAPESLTHAVMQEIHRIDKGQPITEVATLEHIAQEPLAGQRMVMALLLSFAGLALVLAALGIYSVLSYSMAQRTREIGVRVALGAQPESVLRLVVGGGVRLVAAGMAAGTLAALILTRLMAELLYGVRATDPLTFGVVAMVLTATSLLACYIPARRALHIDLMTALRHE
ncbi:MAG TPA: ABC transporter permease [Bryobacteraceae bacterium]|nr:ABC transporter permease [Bryobacteraceae bacterium]